MIKNCLIACFIFLITLPELSAQYFLEYGGGIGVANYLGDIGGAEGERRDFIADMQLGKSRQAINAYARYKLKRYFFVKSELNYLRIAGSDKLSANVLRQYRNLSFVNDIMDLNFQGQFVFFEDMDIGADYRYRMGLRCYVGSGFGLFLHSPKTMYKGEMIKLRPLKTEGVSYSPVGLSLPLTVGFHFTYRKKHRISWELNWRKTFTDYLDDVSSGYGNTANMSPLGVELSNRTDELSIPIAVSNNYGYDPIKNPRNIRGNQNNNDNYVTMTITYGYVIRGKSSFYRSRAGSFFNKGGKKKYKAVRAKF